MTWTEIYNKRKDTKLMKEFGLWARIKGIVVNIRHESCNIKDILGYVIVFAETKGKRLDIQLWEEYDNLCGVVKNDSIMELAMITITEKFFEVCKK